MKFSTTGNPDGSIIVLLHGGGLSDWSWQPIVNLLANDYCVVTSIIDGHGADWAETFLSIQDSADKLIHYIENTLGGRVFVLAGMSLGAQIAIEVLSRRVDIAQYAIIESALVLPVQGMKLLARPLYTLLYGLIKQQWYSQIQAKSLLLPTEMHEAYYRDSAKMSRESLVNLVISNSDYSLKLAIAATSAQVLIVVGEREIGVMRKSADLLHKTIPQSQLHIATAMKHGELSLAHPSDYVRLLLHHANS